MEIAQDGQERLHPRLHFRPLQRFLQLFDALLKGLSLHVRHDEIVLLALGEEIGHLDEVRVLQVGKEARLLAKLFECLVLRAMTLTAELHLLDGEFLASERVHHS